MNALQNLRHAYQVLEDRVRTVLLTHLQDEPRLSSTQADTLQLSRAIEQVNNHLFLL
jgi:hypothetical protein